MFVYQTWQFTDCVAHGMCVPTDPIFHYVFGVEGSVTRSLLNRNWSFEPLYMVIHFEACVVYSPDFTVLLFVWLRSSCPSWQTHFTFRVQVNGLFTFSVNLVYYVWNFISCKSYVLGCHLRVNAKMWGFCLLDRSCPILYYLREVWTFYALLLSWIFILAIYLWQFYATCNATLIYMYIWRLCFTMSYVVAMLVVYVVIRKVLRVHHPSCLYRSWQCVRLNIAPNYLSKLRNSSCL